MFLLELSWFGWAILAVLTIVVMAVVENEKWGWSTFAILITAGIVYYLLPAGTFGVPGLWSAVVYVASYVAIGIVWSIFKWYLYVLKAKERHFRGMGKSKNGLDEYVPSAKENRSNIIGWMAFWPWSAIWTLVDDPVRRMYRALARSLEKVYDNIAKRVFGI